jgi:hypothetical protein
MDKIKDVDNVSSKSTANDSFEANSKIASFSPPSFQFKMDEKEKPTKDDTSGTFENFSYANPGGINPNSENVQLKSNANVNQNQPFQLKATENNTGLPNQLKSGIETLSGQSLNDVNVHYNSDKPAQLNAHAFAQGTDIHVSSGQERHLPHEAWHVVQQKQGRVQPTLQKNGVSINDSSSLETEADVMGTKAMNSASQNSSPTPQLKSRSSADSPIQLKIDVTQLNGTVSVPEDLGDSQSGPVAVRGSGDEHEFSPTDITQGSIGDCYFLAGLIAVAHATPDLLKNNISENSDGTYNVRLYRREVTEGILWDSVNFVSVVYQLYPTFPTTAGGTDTASPDAGTKPPHAYGGDSNVSGDIELWVRLYEKAYALMRGSYSAISSGGSREEALEVLTGQEYSFLASQGSSPWYTNDEDYIKNRVISMMEENIPVTAGTGGLVLSNLSDEMQTYAQDNDIAVPHAYGVVFADESKVRVRNPWGQNADVAEPEMSWNYFINFFPFITVNG